MSKDFNEFVQNPENYSRYRPKPPASRDPNLYTNKPVYDEIRVYYLRLFNCINRFM